MRRIVVGISGASGIVYGVRALERLAAIPDVESHLVMTAAGKLTLDLETDLRSSDVEALADHVHTIKNVAAPIASGSFVTAGMIVAPCSIRVLSAVANSASTDLITRAADVHLKQRRPLVLMVRETPLHPGHLRLMTQAAESGAMIFPPVPAFYTKPESLDEIVDHSVARALENLGIEADDITRWEGPTRSRRTGRRSSTLTGGADASDSSPSGEVVRWGSPRDAPDRETPTAPPSGHLPRRGRRT